MAPRSSPTYRNTTQPAVLWRGRAAAHKKLCLPSAASRHCWRATRHPVSRAFARARVSLCVADATRSKHNANPRHPNVCVHTRGVDTPRGARSATGSPTKRYTLWTHASVEQRLVRLDRRRSPHARAHRARAPPTHRKPCERAHTTRARRLCPHTASRRPPVPPRRARTAGDSPSSTPPFVSCLPSNTSPTTDGAEKNQGLQDSLHRHMEPKNDETTPIATTKPNE